MYCADASCAQFLSPANHITDSGTKITYAICEADGCCKITCVSCKLLLDNGLQAHKCEITEIEKKFKQTVEEKGYQECFVCGRTVELAEACNHITCECGNSFCYICGKDWPGIHGCPQYGPAHYDEEGYNQDGFHKETGLNREGLTRRQQWIQDQGEEAEEESDEEDEDEDVLQHVDNDRRAMINNLPPDVRAETLMMLRIELFQTQGITFNQPQPGGHGQAHPDDEEEDEDDEEQEEQNDEEDEEQDDEEDEEQDDEEDEGEDEEEYEAEDEDPEADGDGDNQGETDTVGEPFPRPEDPLADEADRDDEDMEAGQGADEDDADHFIDEAPLVEERFADDQFDDDGFNSDIGEEYDRMYARMGRSNNGSLNVPLVPNNASSETDSNDAQPPTPQPTTLPGDPMDLSESKIDDDSTEGPVYGPHSAWDDEGEL